MIPYPFVMNDWKSNGKLTGNALIKWCGELMGPGFFFYYFHRSKNSFSFMILHSAFGIFHVF